MHKRPASPTGCVPPRSIGRVDRPSSSTRPCCGRAWRASWPRPAHAAEPEDERLLLSILGRIEPHPDVPAALARLRTRYRIAIISNTSDALMAGTVAALGTPVDFVVTAQQARAYKPDHALFRRAYATMGVTPEQTVHVGMGQFTDLKVCHELGIRSVWIDRVGEPLNPAWPPDATLPDLAGLPALLWAA